MRKKIRVLISKLGLDGHDRGAKVIARSLAKAGMEVVYTGIRQTPEQIANTAVQEDVDVVGLSILSGSHNILFPRIVNLLRERGREDILVVGGGIIPPGDIKKLKAMGIAEVFGPGTDIKQIIKFIETYLTKTTK
jgi:methylmalonyl-CoA mutase, C-terminal domain